MTRSSQRPKTDSENVPTAISPWQVLPALSDEEFAQLKADIAERGIAVAVVVDADSGLVIDGVHRVRAWEELRAEGTRVPDYPREVRRFASDEERLSFSVAANLFRRHLTRDPASRCRGEASGDGLVTAPGLGRARCPPRDRST